MEVSDLIDTVPGRRHWFLHFVDGLRDAMVAMGFQECDSRLVENEFWNSDVLFIPQGHSLRAENQQCGLPTTSLAKLLEEPYASQMAAIHANGGSCGSRGWRTQCDRDFSRRLVLTSRATAVLARKLLSARLPGKHFVVSRCFRPLEPGPLQLPDFYQLGALVSGEDVSLRTLLGFLEHLAQGLGLAGKFRFIPGYSPSTEPTIDIQAEHPVHGWLAIGQGGLLRPEVSEALGIELPLLFWNLGLERMAMTAHRLTDMTGLYESDLSKLRLNRGLTARKSDSVSGKDE